MTLTVLIRKEMLEQWRTYKLLVVGVAFLAFGLISPLTAKMLPEILKSAAGDMIVQLPPPTAMFAVDQYFKNLTQMGLLVVVLTAMGAVAGERERGTAAMTLCKPVSRASFIASKFLAYTAVLAVGIALAALACYYYVTVLFEPIDALDFTLTNLLLGLYLLVTLSLTLLASALVRGTLAAGGLAIGAILALSIAGGLPGVATYGPGALLGWAHAISAGVPAPAWPALAVSLAIVAGCGLLSWVVFRRHEL